MENKRFLKAAILITGLVIVFSMAAAPAFAQQSTSSAPFMGSWAGKMKVQGQDIDVSIKFNADGTGVLTTVIAFFGEPMSVPTDITWTFKDNIFRYFANGMENKCSVKDNVLTIHQNPPQTLTKQK